MFVRYQLVLHPDSVGQYMVSENEEKRYQALITFPDKITPDDIIRFSHDPSARIRLNALILAGKKKDVKFLDIIKEATYDPQLNVRTKACWALGRIRTERAFALLEDVFNNDPSWYVRLYAYNALGRFKPVAKVIPENGSI